LDDPSLPLTNKVNKEFAFIVNLVKTETVDDLVRELRKGGRAIAKETVIADSISTTSSTLFSSIHN
jgi:hypothetical protein